MRVTIHEDGTAWIHDLNANKKMTGSVIGWADDRSETGMLSGIIIEHAPLCVRVKDIRAATVQRPK